MEQTPNKSEIIEIIEGGLEMNEYKVRAYTKLLLKKLEACGHPDDSKFIEMIKRRLNGKYMLDPKVSLL